MISIIGAGPVGSYTASLLAKRGHDVRLFEEHKFVGTPVSCTGIITTKINDVIKLPKEVLVNKLKYVKVYSPNGSSIKAKSNDLVINRTLFDRYMYDSALDSGAESFVGAKYNKFTEGRVFFKHDGKNRRLKTDVLIGADGPASKVRSLIGPKQPDYLMGKQAVVKGDFNESMYEVHFNVDGFFSWVVPESSEIARVGYAYRKFDSKYDEFILSKGKVMSWQGGLIPVFNPLIRTQKNNIYVVGDAAGQVKASTGGGIVPGLKCAEVLAKCVDSGNNYDVFWRKKQFFELYAHRKIRDALDKFNEHDYNKLIGSFSDKKIKRILETSSRDNILGFYKLLFRKPSLLKYGLKLF